MKYEEPWTPYSGESLNHISHSHRASKSPWCHNVGFQQQLSFFKCSVVNIITGYTQAVLNECMLCFCLTLQRISCQNRVWYWSVNKLAERHWSFILQYSILVQLYDLEKQKCLQYLCTVDAAWSSFLSSGSILAKLNKKLDTKQLKIGKSDYCL